ncbi:MAG: amidohydrolase family protein, partial [bacterium]|nr:amidohydrolase family protein [bacterium]
ENSFSYPSTYGGIVAELKQLKSDCLRYPKVKKLQYYLPDQRALYSPELEQLLPYMDGKKTFLVNTENIVEQRILENLEKELGLKTVMVAHPDVWRRKVATNSTIILPLGFTPPKISKFGKFGKKSTKEAKEKIYPQKLAEFFKTHPNISLTAPKRGEYKKLFTNIRALLKQGVEEKEIIAAMTIKPARLLKLSRLLGTLEKGKLADFFISDKPVFREKAKIKTVFVEGKVIEKGPGKQKPPAADLSGSWNLGVKLPMGNYQFTLVLEQDGNDLTGKLVSPVLGTTALEESTISGNDTTLSTVASIMGQDQVIVLSG